jgi:hypothetical protein
MTRPTILYSRDLPGGGYVLVEADTPAESTTHRAHVTVERRADPTRRDGHIPPVIASAEGESYSRVVQQLYSIAADNVSIARHLLRWQAQRSRPSHP